MWRREAVFFSVCGAGCRRPGRASWGSLEAVFSRNRLDIDTLEELEEALILADLGARTADRVVQEVNARVKSKTIAAGDGLRDGVIDILRGIMAGAMPPSQAINQPQPWVLMMVGVNGVGKTTTLGKLAHHFHQEGGTSLLVAADTFRAAAIEQAAIWGERAGVDVIKGQPGGDAAAVAFDAVQAARARQVDRVLIDTAGRLHTKAPLMEELKKMQRVLGRALPEAPHDIWLVLDATTGQNGLAQVRQFHDSLGLTGLVLTKLDGTAKGGIVINVAQEFQLPIRYVGVGEGVDDLRPFDAAEFTAALFDRA